MGFITFLGVTLVFHETAARVLDSKIISGNNEKDEASTLPEQQEL